MNPDEAADLAVRFEQTWPDGPDPWLWEETFKDLEVGAVGTCWAKLTRSGDNNVTIPKFFEQYNALKTHDAGTRPPRADCNECSNTGWAPVYEILQCADGTTIERDTGVQPCRCPWGSDRETVHRNIIDHNEAELDRLFPTRHLQQRTHNGRTNAA